VARGPRREQNERETTRESNITPKRTFDRAYFDRWYRHPVCRVKSRAELEREVEFVLRATEYILGRPVHSVLDVGCGEGNWHPLLMARRPTLRYTGVDPSEYAVRRWGKRRNIHLGSVDHLGVDGEFDLVLCCGVLNYLDPPTLIPGIQAMARRVGGMAYFDMYTASDAITGDTRGAKRRSASWYRAVIKRAGLTPCGMHLYASRATADQLVSLERFPAETKPRR
jgi:SAM-dependent methyltransferase